MSLLSTIITGRKQLPVTYLFYGVHGIGKTDFAANSDAPIFIGTEENNEIDAPRFPKPASWDELLSQLNTIKSENHDFKTLVIDSIDMLQQLAQVDILKDQKGKTMATAFGGYGKAYEKMHDMFLHLRDSFLKPIREQKGLNIILLCHAEKTKDQDPDSMVEAVHYKPNLHKKVAPIFCDWVGAIVFANYYRTPATTDSGKEYIVGDGSRILLTEERPAHVAKNRYNFPFKMDFEKGKAWATLKSHVDKYYADNKDKPVDADKLAHANELAKQAPEDLQNKIGIAISEAKTDAEIDKIIKRLEEIVK